MSKPWPPPLFTPPPPQPAQKGKMTKQCLHIYIYFVHSMSQILFCELFLFWAFFSHFLVKRLMQWNWCQKYRFLCFFLVNSHDIFQFLLHFGSFFSFHRHILWFNFRRYFTIFEEGLFFIFDTGFLVPTLTMNIFHDRTTTTQQQACL